MLSKILLPSKCNGKIFYLKRNVVVVLLCARTLIVNPALKNIKKT